MSILIDKSTRLLVQGITGRDGLFHAKKMAEYGTNVVGGTSPGKGGTMVDDTFPVFNALCTTAMDVFPAIPPTNEPLAEADTAPVL